MATPESSLVDPRVFQVLQSKIDDDTQTRDQIRDIVQSLEKQGDKRTNKMKGPLSDPML